MVCEIIKIHFEKYVEQVFCNARVSVYSFIVLKYLSEYIFAQKECLFKKISRNDKKE